MDGRLNGASSGGFGIPFILLILSILGPEASLCQVHLLARCACFRLAEFTCWRCVLVGFASPFAATHTRCNSLAEQTQATIS